MAEKKTIGQRVDKIEHTVFGNGVRGVVERVEIIEKKQDAHEKKIIWATASIVTAATIVQILFTVYIQLKK